MIHALRARWRFPLAALAVAVMGLTLASAAGAAPTVTFQTSYGFSGPAGLYAYGMEWDASDNTILVGDYWNYRVQRFSATGTHLATYADLTGPKANGGIASAPYDIASDPTDPVGGGSSFWAADAPAARPFGSRVSTVGAVTPAAAFAAARRATISRSAAAAAAERRPV